MIIVVVSPPVCHNFIGVGTGPGGLGDLAPPPFTFFKDRHNHRHNLKKFNPPPTHTLSIYFRCHCICPELFNNALSVIFFFPFEPVFLKRFLKVKGVQWSWVAYYEVIKCAVWGSIPIKPWVLYDRLDSAIVRLKIKITINILVRIQKIFKRRMRFRWNLVVWITCTLTGFFFSETVEIGPPKDPKYVQDKVMMGF